MTPDGVISREESDFRLARHLYDDGFLTFCGQVKRHRYRPAGGRVYWTNGVVAVHYTKARKTDCAECRAIFRAQVRDRSGRDYETKAERERGIDAQ